MSVRDEVRKQAIEELELRIEQMKVQLEILEVSLGALLDEQRVER